MEITNRIYERINCITDNLLFFFHIIYIYIYIYFGHVALGIGILVSSSRKGPEGRDRARLYI